MWLDAMTQRTQPPVDACEWTWMTIDDIQTTVIARTLESPGLWTDLDEDVSADPDGPAADRPCRSGLAPAIDPTLRRLPRPR